MVSEIKVSQFADDTNLFCATLSSLKNALRTVGEFWSLASLSVACERRRISSLFRLYLSLNIKQIYRD